MTNYFGIKRTKHRYFDTDGMHS